VQALNRHYVCLSGTSAKAIDSFEAEPCSPCEERVVSYLEQFVGIISKEVLRQFLLFTTGSSVYLCKI